jgi:hypothetical protein
MVPTIAGLGFGSSPRRSSKVDAVAIAFARIAPGRGSIEVGDEICQHAVSASAHAHELN